MVVKSVVVGLVANHFDFMCIKTWKRVGMLLGARAFTLCAWRVVFCFFLTLLCKHFIQCSANFTEGFV